jgi:hypothetical protein
MLDQMEPSDQVKGFLQEIAEIQQQAHRGVLGRFQAASSTGEEGYSEQVVAVPGGSVITEVWARAEKGIWSTSKTIKPGFTKFFARWKFPTVSLWTRLGSSRQNLFLQEKKVWKVFLTDTSLTQKPLTFFDGCLSKESFASIMEFSPAMVPTALVRSFLATTTLSRRDIWQIEQECFELWRKDGGSVRDPHPILEEVINAMNIFERLGVPAWPTVGDIPIKTYAVIRKVMECYNESISLNQREESIRDKAAKMAGVTRPNML